MLPRHPTGEGAAALYHAAIAVYYLGGLWWHCVSAWRHARARKPKYPEVTTFTDMGG